MITEQISISIEAITVIPRTDTMCAFPLLKPIFLFIYSNSDVDSLKSIFHRHRHHGKQVDTPRTFSWCQHETDCNMSLIKVTVDKTELDPKGRNNEMVSYSDVSQEESDWCRFIADHTSNELAASFVEEVELRQIDAYQGTLGVDAPTVFINPMITDDASIIGLKLGLE